MNEKPKYFDAVGWSWFAMSFLGLLFSLLSVLSFGQLGQAKSLISKQYALLLPEVGNMFSRMMDWVIPLTLVQIAVSAITTVAAWKFLKRQEWARWVLMGINYAFIGLTLVVYFGTVRFMNYMLSMVMKWRTEGVELVSYFHPLGLLILVLLIAPLIAMAWYFHWKPVRFYFKTEYESLKPKEILNSNSKP